MSDKARIGWIGTGVMGSAMAGHLLAAGYPLTIYRRTKSKCQSLLENGPLARLKSVRQAILSFPLSATPRMWKKSPLAGAAALRA